MEFLYFLVPIVITIFSASITTRITETVYARPVPEIDSIADPLQRVTVEIGHVLFTFVATWLMAILGTSLILYILTVLLNLFTSGLTPIYSLLGQFGAIFGSSWIALTVHALLALGVFGGQWIWDTQRQSLPQ